MLLTTLLVPLFVLILALCSVLPVITQSPREYTMRRSATHASARRRDGFVLFELSTSTSTSAALLRQAGAETTEAEADKTIRLSASLAFRTYLPNTRLAKLRFQLTNGQQSELFLLLRNCKFTAIWSSQSPSLSSSGI